MKLLIRILFVLALPLSVATHVSASSLQGKVVEVLDGERLTVMSVNQPLKVKLIAVAAPASKQPYADVARQHLNELVAGKYVTVHFTSLNHENFVVGRVLAKDMDVGEQMIRDGVAWYDKSEASNLTDVEKQEYLGSEQAAKSEARGLWTDPNPVAPWDFRWQEAANNNLFSKPQTLVVKSGGRANRKPLSNEELFHSITSMTGFNESDSGWKVMTPSPGKFSIYMPGNSQEFGAIIPTATGQTAELNYSVGRRGRRFYLLIWAKGPNMGMTDDQVADEAANGLGFGLQRGANLSANGTGGDVRRQRSVRLGSYTGWQYSMSGLGTSGTVRVFSKRIGQSREIYLMASVNATEDDPQVKEFLGSFTINKF